MARKKRHKAPNGTGGMTRLKCGKYQFSFYVSKPDGTKVRKQRRFATKEEGAAWIAELRLAQFQGKPIPDRTTTFGEFLLYWEENYTMGLKPTTARNYETYIHSHLLNHPISKVPISELTTDQLQRYAQYLYKEGRLDGKGGMGSKTVANILRFIHKVLHQAKGNGLCWTNVADYVQLPRLEQHERAFLTTEQVEKLLAASKGEKWYVGMAILADCGLRCAELCALHHSDFCEENGIFYLNITKQLQRVPRKDRSPEEPKTELAEIAPKTKRSRRRVPLSERASQAIQEQIQEQQLQAANCYGLYAADPYLISDDLGNCVDTGTFRNFFALMVNRTDIKTECTPHVLRHSLCTNLQVQGVPTHIVASILGHDPTMALQVYSHTNLSMCAKALDQVQNK